MIVLPFGVWVIGVAPRRVRKINQSKEVGTSKVRVLKFGLTFGLRPNVNTFTLLVPTFYYYCKSFLVDVMVAYPAGASWERS